jgi:hypothetical protein
MVKAEKGGLLHGLGHALGRGRVSTQLIFSHLLGTEGLSRQKNWRQGTKVWIVKQSQSKVWYGWSHDWQSQQFWSGSSGKLSVPCHKDLSVLSFLKLQSDYKENGLEQRKIQNGGRDAKLFLFLVNSWAQGRSQCFSAKAVWTPLTLVNLWPDYVCSNFSSANLEALWPQVSH